MSKPKPGPKTHLVSDSGKNKVGASRFWLLRAAAKRAAEAFEQRFYLEAITLTESLLATRLESRLSHVRKCRGNSKAVNFDPLGRLCKDLIREDTEPVLDWEAYHPAILVIRDWVNERNAALHEMAKLESEDGPDFSEKYEKSREIALRGFRALLAYDAIDREVRGNASKTTATDDFEGGTALDCLRNLR